PAIPLTDAVQVLLGDGAAGLRAARHARLELVETDLVQPAGLCRAGVGRWSGGRGAPCSQERGTRRSEEQQPPPRELPGNTVRLPLHVASWRERASLSSPTAPGQRGVHPFTAADSRA